MQIVCQVLAAALAAMPIEYREVLNLFFRASCLPRMFQVEDYTDSILVVRPDDSCMCVGPVRNHVR